MALREFPKLLLRMMWRGAGLCPEKFYNKEELGVFPNIHRKSESETGKVPFKGGRLISMLIG